MHPGVNLLPGANLHPGANGAHEHGFRYWGFSIFSVSAKTEGSDDCADAKYLNVTIFLAHRKFVNYCTFRELLNMFT